MQNRKIILAIAAVIILATAMLYLFRPQTDTAITATGMIEVTQANLTPKVGGYLAKRDFEEGTEVKADDVIAQIDSTDYQLAFMQTVAAYQSAVSKLNDLEAGSRPAEISSQLALLNATKDAMDKAVSDYNRFEQLYSQGAVSAQQLDNYRVAMTGSQGNYNQAASAYQLALEGSRVDTIKAQRHVVEQMDYAMQAAKKNLEYTNVKAPVSGRVLSKNYEQGEFIQPGAPIATIGDLSDCWVKIYVPSTYLGRVKLDQQAEVKIDSFPDRTFTGRIKEIATEAEFTPRQTITKDERANLVFAVKVALDNSEGTFKPGMPAEVRLP